MDHSSSSDEYDFPKPVAIPHLIHQYNPYSEKIPVPDPIYRHDSGEYEFQTMYMDEGAGEMPSYFEKDGLRTEGDGYYHYNATLNARTFSALVAMSFLWTGSQVPVFLFGGIAPDIYGVIGGVDRWVWIILGYLLALAATCPFVGAVSDLLGRRYVAIIGSCFSILGMIVVSTAKDMNTFIGGMCISGIGGGINELIALAGTAELAPTSKRGTYIGYIIFTLLPWCPAVLYGQLIVKASSFRYVGLLCGVYSFAGLLLTVLFYHPPPRVNSVGISRREVLRRIDYIGGFLSISGVLCFLMGLVWGGYGYSWSSAHALVPLILGLCLLVAFVFWEMYGTAYPMVPSRLKKNPRILLLILFIIFLSGANLTPILFFWPTQAFNIYGDDPVQIGLRGLPVGFAILGGALIMLLLIGLTGGRIRLLMVCSAAVMTAGTGSMSIAKPDNLGTMWGLLILAGLGIGGIAVPASTIASIICPDDLIATITALTLSIRIVGGAIGFTIYYSVFYSKLVSYAIPQVGFNVVIEQLKIYNGTIILDIVTAAANSEYNQLHKLLEQNTTVADPTFAYNLIIEAMQWTFADAYRWVYYISIIFGGIALGAACFLGDIQKYMDDHVAVVME